MSMRVNHNIPAMSALRHLGNTNKMAGKNLERLSSGMKINSAADGPAGLMISERMRAQISGIRQAMSNSETSISMVQTAEGSLHEVSNILINLRQLAIHAANEGANDDKMLQADQSEIENLLSSLDRIARYTQFGTRTLLDGSNGANGITVGDGMLFVKASVDTQASPENGYEVDITQVATRALATGTKAIDVESSKTPMVFVINEGGRTASLDTSQGDLGETIAKLLDDHESSPETITAENVGRSIREVVAGRLQKEVDQNGLEVDVYISETGMLNVRHRQFGSEHKVSVTSNQDGLLSAKANVAQFAQRGKDVAGFIGGEVALGRGQFLTGAQGTKVADLTIQYTKALGTRVEEIKDPDTGEVIGREIVQEDNEALVGKPVDGYVHVQQGSLAYQVGPNRGQQVKISMASVSANRLAKGLENQSGYSSLADIDVTNSQGAQDALLMIDTAISEVSGLRADLGSFQKNALETTLNSLRVADENLTNAESILRDSDIAQEMSDFTKNQIMLASGTAMAAQANQLPRSVLQLLAGAQG